MAKYVITLKPTFYGDIRSLNEAAQKQLPGMQEELADHAEEPRGNTIKKLKGYTYLWRYRIHDYRIIYSVIGNTVELLAAGIRRDIYERFHYDADNVDEAFLKGLEAQLYPESAVAHDIAQDQKWLDYVIVKQNRQEAERQRQREAESRLPKEITQELLTRWRIPPQYHTVLAACKTADELLDAGTKGMPGKIVEFVIDRIFEKNITDIAGEPTFILRSSEDLVRYVKGDISRFLLKLDEQQTDLVDWALQGPTMIKGGPGTGKSTVAIYRVRTLIEKAYLEDQPPPRILFTTYTNALVNVSQELLEQLLQDLPENYRHFTTSKAGGCIAVTTVDALARRMADPYMRNRKPESYSWQKALQTVRSQYKPAGASSLERAAIQKALDRLDNNYLTEEIETIIEGRGLESLEAYLETDRRGRGQALHVNARRVVWDLYLRAKDWLEKNKLITWGQIRLLALEHVHQQQEVAPFDYVIVDEAQDFTPVALRLCLEMVKNKQSLFLAADLSQSIYNRSFSFSDVHQALQVVGRTRILRRNYRTTGEIMAGAAEIMADTQAGDMETLLHNCVKFDRKPTLAIFPAGKDHLDVIIRYIYEAALDLKLPIGAAAILCTTGQAARDVAAKCQEHQLPAKFMSSSEVHMEAPEVKVMTIHTAKGLEFPIVVLPNVFEGILPRVLPEDSPDDPQAVEDADRRLFYVAATRAMRRLLVTTGNAPQFSRFCRNFTERHWHMQTG